MPFCTFHVEDVYMEVSHSCRVNSCLGILTGERVVGLKDTVGYTLSWIILQGFPWNYGSAVTCF